MTYVISVVYPTGSKFDKEYYLTKHMPLVQKLWGPAGLKSWRVVQYTNPGAPYAIQAWLEWESAEHAGAGTKSTDGATIFADVPNFSEVAAQVLTGEQVGFASW
ncbi:hypothetical protein GQX73_g8692 [Xylaria multiplex]|uniref:EthD domain-containing protein n=1 Tax=Xylaria multiplex TaxID=323545 RepID=A0A7C8IMK5_9PEZI|nr:hypothetical protein GQX73_g8692 [Xylaria multiplex]